MVKLKGIIDTVNILEKYDIDCEYNYDEDTYTISEKDFERILELSKNKKYIENLKAENGGRLYSHNYM